MLKPRVAPTPRDTVFRDGKSSVYRFRPAEGQGRSTGRTHVPVLLVPSMINRWYIFDLREGASLVAGLTHDAPWDTYCFDWGVTGDEDRYLTWDDVVAKLERAVRFVLRSTGASSLAFVGYSMGATLSGIHAALHPETAAALVNLAGPFDFDQAGGLRLLADRRWFNTDAITSAGNVSQAQIQSGILALSPTEPVGKWVRIAEQWHDPSARAGFAALEKWAAEDVSFPAAAYGTYVKELYQQNQLIRGEHRVRGEAVDLSRITCPVLTIAADRDVVCPRNAAIALNAVVRSNVKDVLDVPGGHVGAVVGTQAARTLYPPLKSWLTQYAKIASTPLLPPSRL